MDNAGTREQQAVGGFDPHFQDAVLPFDQQRNFDAGRPLRPDAPPQLAERRRLVAGDRDQLVQMLLNLVKNAAEAAPREGGVLTLATRYQHGLRVQLGTTAERLELPITIEVRDNGAGVPPDMIDHLFEPFVSGRPRGRGLGLSIVAKIVADHGGMVAYAPGRPGAIFRVRLPAMRAGTRGTGA